VVNIKRKPAAR